MKKISVTCEKIEDIEKLKNAGADEIMVALKDSVFSALQTFSLDEIEVMVNQVHALGMGFVVIMNRLFSQSLIEQAKSDLKAVLKMGVDAVIIADPGLYQTAAQLSLENKLIYNPETLLTSGEDAKFWLSTGMQSINISPILTAEEILLIANQAKHAGIQVFGYLLMSISKRPLLTAYQQVIDSKVSLNENHHLFLREDKREGMMPAYENQAGMMIYTDFIQESFGWLNAFADAGIERFELYGNYIPMDAYLDAISMYQRVLNGEDGEAVRKEFVTKYPTLQVSDGYYGQKTVR